MSPGPGVFLGTCRLRRVFELMEERQVYKFKPVSFRSFEKGGVRLKVAEHLSETVGGA